MCIGCICAFIYGLSILSKLVIRNFYSTITFFAKKTIIQHVYQYISFSVESVPLNCNNGVVCHVIPIRQSNLTIRKTHVAQDNAAAIVKILKLGSCVSTLHNFKLFIYLFCCCFFI